MKNTLQHYRIFIASPGGLAEERKLFRDVVENFNQIDAIDRGFYFQPVGWEDTLGQQGRPQQVINDDLRKCHFMFILLHDRWGSPTYSESKFSSGTEEEFHVALECLNSDDFPMLRIALFFKDVPKNQLADPGMQLSRVLAFKKEREENKDFLFETFDVKENFGKKVNFHLAKILRELEKENNNPSKRKINSSIETSFHDADFEWLNNITRYNNWELAFEKAEDYVKKGKTIEAEIIFSQISQRSNNPFLIARYGKYLRKLGHIYGAQDIIKKAQKLAIILNDNNSIAYCYRQLGRIEEYKGNMKVALELFYKAHDIYLDNDNLLSVARTLRDIAFAHNKLGQSDISIDKINISIKIYNHQKEYAEKAASLGYLGVIYKDLGRFDEAQESHEEALKIQSKLNNKEALAQIYSNLAVISRLRRDYNTAIEQHKKSLAIFESLNNKRGIARELANIGVILRREGKYEESIDKHYMALEIEEKVGNDRGMQIQFSNIGLNHLEMDELGKAEYYFNKALNISLKLDDLKGESHQYKNFCSLFIKKKDYEQAFYYVEKAIKVDTTVKNTFGQASCYRLKAMIFFEKGEIDEGLKRLRQSQNIYKQLKLNDYIQEIEEEIKTLLNSN